MLKLDLILYIGPVNESGIVPDPEIGTGSGPVPDPHTIGAAGDQGLHATGEGGQGPVPVLHVGGIETTGVVPVPDLGLPTRGGGTETETETETERGGDQGIKIEIGIGIGTVAEIDAGHLGDDHHHQVLTELRPKNQSKKINLALLTTACLHTDYHIAGNIGGIKFGDCAQNRYCLIWWL